MRPGDDTTGGRVLLALASGLIRAYVDTVGRTWRTEVVEGGEVLRNVLARKEPVIFTVWHNRAVMAVSVLLRSVYRKGHVVSVMASGSRDGEIVSRAIEGWGVEVVRGSATRGGREALWGAYRTIRRSGASPVVVPDGPTGPVYRYKTGVLHLARLSRVPVVPIGLAASRYRTIKSWDRLMIPRAFCRIGVAIGEPRLVPRSLDADAVEDERLRQEAVLNGLTAQAEAAVGSHPPPDLPTPSPALPAADP